MLAGSWELHVVLILAPGKQLGVLRQQMFQALGIIVVDDASERLQRETIQE